MMWNPENSDDVMAAVLSQVAPPVATRPPSQIASPTRWDVPGFDGKARVLTSFGMLPIEALRVRDELKLPTGNFQRVVGIDQIKLDADFLVRCPDARPILIGAGAFGAKRPERSFLVSIRQEMHLTSYPSESTGILAANFEGRMNVLRQSSCAFIRYYLFHLGEPATVCVEGVWCTVRP